MWWVSASRGAVSVPTTQRQEPSLTNWFNAWRVEGCDGSGNSTLACLKHEGPGIEVGVHFFYMSMSWLHLHARNFRATHTTLPVYHGHRATLNHLVPIGNSAELLDTIERVCTADAAHAFTRDVVTQESHLRTAPRGGTRVLCIASPVLPDRCSSVL